jgi:hypothetical protein
VPLHQNLDENDLIITKRKEKKRRKKNGEERVDEYGGICSFLFFNFHLMPLPLKEVVVCSGGSGGGGGSYVYP